MADMARSVEPHGTDTAALPLSRVKFDRSFLDKLKAAKPDKQRTIWDTNTTGLCLLWSPGPADKPGATVTFRVAYYLKGQPGVPRYIKLGRYGDKRSPYTDKDGEVHYLDCTSLDKVRERAGAIRTTAREGNDPKRPKLSDTFAAVIPRFMQEHANKKRSAADTERLFNVYVLPEWGHRKIEEIEKDDVTALLNKISNCRIRAEKPTRADGSVSKRPKKKYIGTPSVANATFARLSKLFNWWVGRHGSNRFRSPIVKEHRNSEADRKRSRVLRADEIRALWKACEELGVYGDAVQCALLTAQRFYKVAKEMRRSDIKDQVRIEGRYVTPDKWADDVVIENVWDPTRNDDPENKLVSVVPLSGMARAIIDAVPIIVAERRTRQDFVFSLDGRKPLNGWSRFKKRLDQKMLAHMRARAAERGEDPTNVELQPWQKRDLRRTAKTLMMRNGVSRAVSEHCLAHKIAGVEGIYDRADYLLEKQQAFEVLAKVITRIVDPPEASNVVALPSRPRRRRRLSAKAAAQ